MHSQSQSWQSLARNCSCMYAGRRSFIADWAWVCRGNHLPFRQLCAELGADVTMSEMAFARQLLKQNVVEKARLRIASNEPCYGEQPNSSLPQKCTLHKCDFKPVRAPSDNEGVWNCTEVQFCTEVQREMPAWPSMGSKTDIP